MKYVVKKNDKLLVKTMVGQTPQEVVAELPEGISPEDYPYLKETPIYDTVSGEVIVGYSISVDQDLKNADLANVQQKKYEEAVTSLRKKRDLLLKDTDYIMMPDYPMSDKSAYESYRQALRDLPSTVVDVHNPVYPTKPEMS